MASSANFSKSESDYDSHQLKETLLTKYRIPIQHFEFDYIEKCTDGKELEKILLVLRSGEEGYFPELEKAVEQRVTVIKPKSKLLRIATQVLTKCDVQDSELEVILGDLNSWVNKVSKDDNELEIRKSYKKQDVPVRKPATNYISYDKQKDKTEKRISSTDFKAWDKYDPDTELLKMELKDKEVEDTQKIVSDKSKKQKTVIINEFGTEAESKFVSNREREKGNEFFKHGEFEEALLCYSNSVRLTKNVDNLNNRAITLIKLQKYSEAIKDCKEVLNLERDNLKAHSRIAEAFQNEQKFEEALKHIEFVIEKDPNNGHAQALAESIRKNCGTCLQTTKMQITDTD